MPNSHLRKGLPICYFEASVEPRLHYSLHCNLAIVEHTDPVEEDIDPVVVEEGTAVVAVGTVGTEFHFLADCYNWVAGTVGKNFLLLVDNLGLDHLENSLERKSEGREPE